MLQAIISVNTLWKSLVIPDAPSLFYYHHMLATVKGLDAFPSDEWPEVPVVYYAYHIMVLFGFTFGGISLLIVFLWWCVQLFQTRWMLWILMLAALLPYITALGGWITAEAGRQLWLVYSLFKTVEGVSDSLNSSKALFTLVGYNSLYAITALLYFMLIQKLIVQSPQDSSLVEAQP